VSVFRCAWYCSGVSGIAIVSDVDQAERPGDSGGHIIARLFNVARMPGDCSPGNFMRSAPVSFS
jgi:hypothetical protein